MTEKRAVRAFAVDRRTGSRLATEGGGPNAVMRAVLDGEYDIVFEHVPALAWTEDRPTEEGHYWFKWDDDSDESIVVTVWGTPDGEWLFRDLEDEEAVIRPLAQVFGYWWPERLEPPR